MAPETLRALVDALPDQGERKAIVTFRGESERSWSYQELHDRVVRLAAGLRNEGLEPGEPVAILAPPEPAWIAALLAIVAAGGIAVPLADSMAPEEVRRLLDHAGARRLFTTRSRQKDLAECGRDQGLSVHLLGEEDGEDARSWRRLLAEPSDLPELDPDAPACLLYTSGTTGTPKGVPLTHRNLLSNVEALDKAGIAGHDDRVLLPLPLHHTYPLTVGVLAVLGLGAMIVLPEAVTGPQLMRALEGSRATIMVGVPRLYNALIEGIEGRLRSRGALARRLFALLLAFSIAVRRLTGWRIGRLLFRPLHKRMGGELRILGSGGAKLDPEIAWKLEGLGFEVVIGYGLTETAPILTFTRRGHSRLDSVGEPVPGVELRIEREGTPDAPEGQGEVLARGPNVFKGYWQNEEATREAFTEDGWYRTGDLGRVDADGHLVITGRARELIVLAGGKNVFPEDVEGVLQDSPYLDEVAVLERDGSLVGLVRPDSDRLRQEGSGRAAAAVREAIEAGSRRLPRHERLAGYAIVHTPLPRTQLGKLQRHLLPEIFEKARSADRPAVAEPTEEDRRLLQKAPAGEIFDWLKERLEQPKLGLDTSPQLDLGLDSFAWMNLGLELEERFRLGLGEEQLAGVMTVRELLEAAQAAAEGGGAESARPEALTPEQERWLQPRGLALKVLAALLYGLDWLIMRGVFRQRVRGREHVPADGPVVITPNHASYLDPFALGAALSYRQLERVYWAGWTGVVFQGPLTRLFSRLTQTVPVDPDRGVAASLAVGLAVLERGHALVWFPEGRRTPDGELQPFLPGIGHLLQRSGARVVPVWIGGTYKALPPDRALPRLARVEVRFGEPVTVDQLDQGGDAVRIAEALRERVAALAPV